MGSARTGHEQGQYSCDWRVHHTQKRSQAKACCHCKRNAGSACMPHASVSLTVSIVAMQAFDTMLYARRQ